MGTHLTIGEVAAELAGYADARLTVDMIPRALWGKSLANTLPRSEWDQVRQWAYKRASNRCEVCRAQGPSRHPLECDEVWEYDDTAAVQQLVELRALCPDCHAVKHLGRSFALGRGQAVLTHLARVNGWDKRRVETYVELVKSQWTLRNEQPLPWRQDVSWFKGLRIG